MACFERAMEGPRGANWCWKLLAILHEYNSKIMDHLPIAARVLEAKTSA